MTETEDSEMEDLDGPPELLNVGFSIKIPHEVAGVRAAQGAYGRRPESEHQRRVRIGAWVEDLGRVVVTWHPNLRPQIQPETTGFTSSPARWVIVWWDRAYREATADEAERIRLNLEELGYHVSSVSFYYDPAMA